MAKKKKTSSTWLRQEINTKLSCIFILLLFLLCVLVAYTYSIPSVGIPIESQIQTNFQNFIQSLTPIPTPITTKRILRVMPGSIFNPNIPITPQPTPIANLPYLTFSKLIIYQFRNSTNIKNITSIINNTATPTRIVTDTATIEKLYDDIKNLPPWPSGKAFNCPNDPVNAFEYVLNFYSNNTLTIHALVQPSGCPEVGLAHYQPRIGGAVLFEDLQQTLNLSKQEFYGY